MMNTTNQSGRKRSHEESNTPNKTTPAEREYILNADGTILHDHKGVSIFDLSLVIVSDVRLICRHCEAI